MVDFQGPESRHEGDSLQAASVPADPLLVEAGEAPHPAKATTRAPKDDKGRVKRSRDSHPSFATPPRFVPHDLSARSCGSADSPRLPSASSRSVPHDPSATSQGIGTNENPLLAPHAVAKMPARGASENVPHDLSARSRDSPSSASRFVPDDPSATNLGISTNGAFSDRNPLAPQAVAEKPDRDARDTGRVRAASPHPFAASRSVPHDLLATSQDTCTGMSSVSTPFFSRLIP